MKISRTEIDFCKECFCVNLCSAYCGGSSLAMVGKENGVIRSRCVYQQTVAKEIIKKLYIYFHQNDDAKIKRKVIRNIQAVSKQGMTRLLLNM